MREHEEFERAMTGRAPKKGMGPLGWTLVTFGFLFTVGIVGAGAIAYTVAHRVDHVTQQLGLTGGVMAGNLATRVAQAPELVSMDPEQGVRMLSDMDRGDFGKGFVKSLMNGKFRMPDGSAHPDAPDAPHAPGASRADISRDGGSVNIRSRDGSFSLRLDGGDNGGFLTIDSDNGSVRIDVQGDDDGGRLHISTGDDNIAVVVGDNADREPSWVDDLDRVPSAAQPVVSLTSDKAAMGAVAWESDDMPGDVLVRYQQALEDQGYEVRVSERFRQDGSEHAALWARNEADGRMVFVVAVRDQGDTGVFLGFGEKH